MSLLVLAIVRAQNTAKVYLHRAHAGTTVWSAYTMKHASILKACKQHSEILLLCIIRLVVFAE